MAAAHPDGSTEIPAVTIIAAQDPLLIERKVAAIRDRAVPEAMRALNYDVIDGGRLTADQIVAAASTLPMMAKMRMVLVPDLAMLPAAELQRLLPYIENPAPTTAFVAVTKKLDRRLKFYARCKKLGVLDELAPPRRLGTWLSGELSRLGVEMSAPAQRRLIEVIGADLSRLSLTCSQLELYSGGRRIEAADVEDLVATTREHTVFELTDAIGGGESVRALELVEHLCDQRQSGIGVVIMLARHIRQLSKLHVARRSGVPKAGLAKAVGAPPFVIDKLARQLQRFPEEAIAPAFAQLARADGRLKGRGGRLKTLGRDLGERTILGSLVLGLIALGEQ